jgi:hypothetical protein
LKPNVNDPSSHKSTGVTGLLIGLAGLVFLFILGIVALFVLDVSLHPFGGEMGGRLSSPQDSSNVVFFTYQAFRIRDWEFYSEPAGKRPRRIGCFGGINNFDSAQWTRDGQVFAGWARSMNDTNHEPFIGFAYDFQADKVLAFPQISYSDDKSVPPADRIKLEQAIQAMIQAHGGLDATHIDDPTLRKLEKTLWLWQIPKTAPPH